MKTLFQSLLQAMFLVGLLVATLIWLAARPTDVMTDLQLTTEHLQNQVMNQLTTNDATFDLPYKTRRIGRQLSAEARTSAVKAMGAVLRAYVKSADFRSRYDQQMRDRYHVSDAQTKEAEQTEKTTMNDVQAIANQQIAQTSTVFTQMPPATLAMMLQQQMLQFQQQMATASAPEKAALARDLAVLRQLQPMASSKPAEFKTQYLAFMNRYMAQQMNKGLENEEENLADNKAKAADYRTRLAEYNANAKPETAIKKRLQAFITLAESVDFDAKVVPQGSKMEFVRADYRSQSDEWKLMYRIGREPVLAARDVARTWLSELK
ncbi:hypothetical protein IC229_06770 [Spirosoma sp. BT702]|uniref:Uncharacterized protein n=1 Tax=Spirosoma profusum TaxID=2771354 RepID=A0A926XUK4_9BACT|nr:hypothetical protein [Spirosoma profusum]MBD2700329.1 hypothetical protein [Spirosoma profusum]